MLIANGLILVALGRASDLLENQLTELRVISGQLRAHMEFCHSAGSRKPNYVGGHVAKPMGKGAISIDTSVGELHFAERYRGKELAFSAAGAPRMGLPKRRNATDQ